MAKGYLILCCLITSEAGNIYLKQDRLVQRCIRPVAGRRSVRHDKTHGHRSAKGG